jgi:hypothetical protein
MKLRDVLMRNPDALAIQLMGEDVYEVAIISDIPMGREYWSFTKRKANMASGSDDIISQKDTFDEIIDFVNNYPGPDPNRWSNP